MKLRRGILAALAALMLAAPTALAADDPAADPTGVECVAADGGSCTDPGASADDPPADAGDNQGDTPDDSGANDGSSSDDTTSDDNVDPADGSGDAGDDQSGDDRAPVDLCTWEPWNCGDGPGPGECDSERIAKGIPCYIVDPPLCDPDTPHGSKICIPVDPPCSTDPDTGEVACWQPPEVCLVARFASEEAAAEAGCLPDPVQCDPAENADGEVFCGEPLPCFVDEEGNKICAMYDMAPGGGKGGSSGSGNGGQEVGVCVVGVKSPCNGNIGGPKPQPRTKPPVRGGKKPAPKGKKSGLKPKTGRSGTPAKSKKPASKPKAKPSKPSPKAKKPAAKQKGSKPKAAPKPKPRARRR